MKRIPIKAIAAAACTLSAAFILTVSLPPRHGENPSSAAEFSGATPAPPSQQHPSRDALPATSPHQDPVQLATTVAHQAVDAPPEPGDPVDHSAHDCRQHQHQAARAFGGASNPVTVHNLPESRIKEQLRALGANERETALNLLNRLPFTDLDVPRLFVTPDGKSIGIDLRPPEQIDTPPGNEAIDGKLFAITKDCFNPNHQGPSQTYHLKKMASEIQTDLNTYGVDLPESWLGSQTRILGKTIPHERPMAAGIEWSAFQADQVIYDSEAQPAPEPPVEAGQVTTDVRRLLVIYANTKDKPTYPATKRQASLDIMFNNTRSVNLALRAASYGHVGIELGDAVTVTLNNITASTTDSYTMGAEMLSAASSLGYKEADYDHVLLMCPEGTLEDGSSNWTAYAQKPGNKSWYSYAWSSGYLDGIVHELGHNLGFGHAGILNESDQYGDQSCVMGYSHSGTKCATFGAAKKIQSGWMNSFPGTYQTITSDATFDLYPVGEHPDTSPGTRIVKIPGELSTSYVRNNDAIYANLFTSTDADKVLIHEFLTAGTISRRHAAMAAGSKLTKGNVDIIFERYGPNKTYATVSYDVANDGNAKPTANSLALAIAQNSSKTIPIPASDPDSQDTLQFSIVLQPTSGSVAINGSNLTYTPNLNFTGSDSVVYKVFDGKICSFGTIDVTVFNSLGMLVTMPNGGEQVSMGLTQKIYWGSSVGGDVMIELYQGGVYHSTIAASTPNDGDFDWLVPGLPAADNYNIKITRLQSPNESDAGNANFSIISTIRVTGPQTGGSYYQSGTLPVTWASPLGGSVRIELLKGGVIDRTITASTSNDGSFHWTIPSLQTLGTDYRVRISSVEDPMISDTITANFSIIAASNTLLDANMNTNPGFTMTGDFQYGSPSGNNVPSAAYSGTKMYDTILNSTSYDAGTLTTRAINCSNHTGVTVSFYENVFTYNTYTVEVSNNGNQWRQLSSVSQVYQPSNNWTQRTYNISADADGKATVYIRWSKTGGSEWTGGGVAIDDVLITGTFTASPPTPNVSIAQSGGSTNVTEGGASDTYTVRLDSQPTSNVTVSVIPDGTQVNASPSTLTFTSSNWNTPQTVTVTAIDDNAHELSHTGLVSHTTNSQDPSYKNLAVEAITANITDNDNYAPIVTATASQTQVGLEVVEVPWTPAMLTTKLWLDATDSSSITTEGLGTGVRIWNDKSGNNHHVSQTVTTKQPLSNSATINNLNTIAFDGSDDVLATATNCFGPTITDAFVLFVHKVSSTGLNGSLFSLTGDTNVRWQAHAPWKNGDIYFDAGGGSGANRLGANYGVSAGTSLITSFYCSVTDNVQQVYKNGSLFLSDNSGHSVAADGPVLIGSDNTSFQHAAIGEVIMIRNTVSTDDRQKLEGYLAHKWGLASNLPSTPTKHPYKDAAPIANGSGATITLGGSATDPDVIDPITTLWSLESSVPSGLSVVFANPNSITTDVTFNAFGTYVLKLTATDGLATTSQTVTITVSDSTITYTVNYTAGANGSITGQNSQTVEEGGDATAVTAVPNSGYLFKNWSDGSTANPRTDTNVTANISVTANFELNEPPTVNAGDNQFVALVDDQVPWTPNPSELQAWFDASDANSIVLENGSTTAVKQWSDKSGNGRHLTQTTAAAQPTLGVNEIQMPLNKYLQSATGMMPSGSGGRHIFAVINNPTTSGHGFISQEASGWNARVGFAITGEPAVRYSGAMTYNGGNLSATDNLIAVSYNSGNNVSTMRYAVNGTNRLGTIISGDGQLASNSTKLYVGCNYNSGLKTSEGAANFRELIILTDATLSTDTQQKLEGYLAHKWGLAGNLPTTPSVHPYREAAPTTGSIGATVNLNGSVGDGNGTTPTASWSVVSTVPAGLSVEFADAASPVTMASFSAAGTYTLQLTASDGIASPVSDQVVITVTDGNSAGYNTWLTSSFTNAFTDTAMTSNPDADNRSNLLEFAFGTDPTKMDMGPLATDGSRPGDPAAAKVQGGGFALYYIRRTDHGTPGSVNYSTHFSDDLSTFESVSAGLEVVGSAGTGYEVVRVPFPASLSNGKPAKFGYVKVQPAP